MAAVKEKRLPSARLHLLLIIKNLLMSGIKPNNTLTYDNLFKYLEPHITTSEEEKGVI